MLRDMRDRFGTSIVYASHDLTHARRIGETVFFASEGGVEGPFDVAPFFGAPPTAAAAEYLRPERGAEHPR
jgi:ABC-type sulfate/molybdate transport systems ATPase subunit